MMLWNISSFQRYFTNTKIQTSPLATRNAYKVSSQNTKDTGISVTEQDTKTT